MSIFYTIFISDEFPLITDDVPVLLLVHHHDATTILRGLSTQLGLNIHLESRVSQSPGLVAQLSNQLLPWRRWLSEAFVVEDHGHIRVCLKMSCTPLYPMVNDHENRLNPEKPNGFHDHYPVFKWLYIIGNIPNIFRQTNMMAYVMDI